MSVFRQGWLVARREIRERINSKGLWVGTALMLLVVVAAIVVPATLETDVITRDVGFAGATPAELPAVATDQGDAVDVTVRVHRYDDAATGEEAVRDEDIDVLVVDGRRLQWRGTPDERLRALLTGAIQLVAVQERATEAGLSPTEFAALAAPVPVENEELGITGGRSPDDETAAYITSILLLVAMATYGQLVLTGVVQEKSSRVVEVLLARMPARNLLAGKIAGIGLLGFAQFALTALAAVTCTLLVDSVDIPAVSGGVLAWVVAWFLLGYAMYAVSYGAVGSLASRTEDASSIAAPVTTVLIVGYWASLIAVGSDPEGGWARAASLFPATAPFAMPGRIALGAAPWWEPVLAVALTLAAIAGLVVLAGRVYAGAILHAGPTLRLRDAWGRSSIALHAPTATPVEHAATGGISRGTNALIIGIGVALGVTAFVLADDFVMAVAIGVGFYAVASRMVKARDRAQDRGAPPLSPGRAPWPGHRAPGRRGSAPGRARP